MNIGRSAGFGNPRVCGESSPTPLVGLSEFMHNRAQPPSPEILRREANTPRYPRLHKGGLSRFQTSLGQQAKGRHAGLGSHVSHTVGNGGWGELGIGNLIPPIGRLVAVV